MKPCRNLAVIGLAVFLAAGAFALNACSAPNDPSGGHSADANANAGKDHAKAAAQDAKAAVSDAWITTKVKSELATTKGVESTDVSVTTVDGVVTLTGVLPTDTAMDKAIAVAKSIKGVKAVDASGLKAKG